MKKIKTNDKVTVIVGKDKGKSGKVIQTFPEDELLVVEGVNTRTKHIRKQKGQTQGGQKIEFFAPMNISNVKLNCPKCSKLARVKFVVNPDTNKKNRVCKKCNEVID